MRTIIQIVRKHFWWILLSLLIIAAVFIRPYVIGFKEGVKKKGEIGEIMAPVKGATAMMAPPKRTTATHGLL